MQLRAANPGNWGADEWQNLLDGRLGPWVMASHGERVISICHTPVANASAAEAGVWTHPDFRGGGHAAATTAEWAVLMRPSRRLLFYSTSRTNWSSQRVAARLGLRRIGFLWQLQSMNSGAGRTDRRDEPGHQGLRGMGCTRRHQFGGEVVLVWRWWNHHLRCGVARHRRVGSTPIAAPPPTKTSTSCGASKTQTGRTWRRQSLL